MKCAEEKEIIHFEMEMLENNQIRGLVPAVRAQEDVNIHIYYDTSGLQSLEELYTGEKLKKGTVKRLIADIVQTARNIEEYLLNYNHLRLQPTQIYRALAGEEFCFCYEPWDGESFAEQLSGLTQWILDHVNYKERQDVVFAYELQRFCRDMEVNVDLLEQFLKMKERGIPIGAEDDEESKTEERYFSEEQIAYNQPPTEEPEKEDKPENRRSFLQKIFNLKWGAEKWDDYGEANLRLAEEEVPYASDDAVGKLVPLRSGKRTIYIKKYPCVLGKDANSVDYAVAEEGISRTHLKLTMTEGKVWAEDLNSSNGTFVNDEQLMPFEPWELHEGDEIRMALTAYIFQS